MGPEKRSNDEDIKRQTVFKDETGTEIEKREMNKTSSGLEENIAGLLCYLVGFITGIVFLMIEKENCFIRFHAMQSIFVWIALFAVSIILLWIPVIGLILGFLLTPLYALLWLFLMWKAYQGELFKLPIVGDLVEKQISKL